MLVFVYGPQNTGTNLTQEIIKGYTTCIWKHIGDFDRLKKVVEAKNGDIFLFMFRPLSSWINSMKKCPYETNWNGDIDKEVRWETVLWGEYHYENIIELYIHYYENYIELCNTFPNCFIISYYELIDNGYGYYCSVAKLCGKEQLTESDYAEILSRPAKEHGTSVKNSDEAIAKRNMPVTQKDMNKIAEYKDKLLNIEAIIKSKIEKIF